MFTLFSMPKAFRGHFGIIQRNAILSWTRIHPRPEIILFGEEDGIAELAREAGLRHVQEVARNEYGTPLMSDLFERAQSLASHNILCYVNADIILPRNFSQAVQRVASWRERFLMVGTRFNVDLDEPKIYDSAEQESRLLALVKSQNNPIAIGALDYFVFPRGQVADIPPFAIGRGGWDNWLLWKTRSLGIPLVDVTPVVLAIHQNHDYSYGAEPGHKDVLTGEEVKRNGQLVGRNTCTLDDITHKLTPQGMRRDFRNRFLKHTRSLRRRVGLSKENLEALKSAVRLVSRGERSKKAPN